jgi:DNA polymerase-4
MDAFYASVEEHDDPKLRGKPLVVGGPSRRGVVMAASYAARPFGVHSAMPMAEALRKCPGAIVVPPRMGRYSEVSGLVFEIFGRFTPLVQGLSLDEAFLDVTESRSLFGDGPTIARQIKDAIRRELGLTASAGVATSKFVAKVASDLRKPDALVVAPLGEERAFLAPLPIERMWGIGAKTAPKIRAAGFATIGDLADAPPERLEAILGVWGRQVHLLARGEDDRAVEPMLAPKSIGSEETHEYDLTTRAAIEKSLLDRAAHVAQRMVREGYWGRTVMVKLKYADFTLLTRRTTLPDLVSDTTSIHEAARALLDRFPLEDERVRLVGVAMSDLSERPPQPKLFADKDADKRRKLEEVVNDVSARFGDEGITRGTLVTLGLRAPPKSPPRSVTLSDPETMNDPERPGPFAPRR